MGEQHPEHCQNYMLKYNEAQLNDGISPEALRYSQETIQATKSKSNPVRFPDNDFYSDYFLRDNSTGINIYADIAGGSENTQYYVNTSWKRNNGWLNTPQGDVTDLLSFRGNLDFQVNDFMKMSVNTAGNFSFNKQPNANSIWSIASTELPNNYPIMWDPNIIDQEDFREFIKSSANLIDGQLLGGNSSFLNNSYGLFTQNGNKKFMQRGAQFNGNLYIDLSAITDGLSANLYGGMNFYNSLFSAQNPQFAVYEPIFGSNGQIDTVYVHGIDKSANRYETQNEESDFFRQMSFYSTINYEKSFDRHHISATGLIYNDILSQANIIQKNVLLHTGVFSSYSYSNKYLAELSLMGIGSRKLNPDNRIELTPAFGLGWVLSGEEFIKEYSFIDFLKIRSSFGVTKNDFWDDYFLYKSIFEISGDFNYENGVSRNSATNYTSVPNKIKLQKRRDFTLGLDALLFNQSLNTRIGYFNSTSMDNITQMSSTYPNILGYNDLIYSNYNSDRTQGFELGLSYSFTLTKNFKITTGGNMLYISPKITKIEEPIYEGLDIELRRKGTPTDAIWGLKSNGLYSENDFDNDGNLISNLPIPTYGKVQPGDIKYLDNNNDNIIDQKDLRIIGNSIKRTQYSLYVDINYKDFNLYILGIGSSGGYGSRNGSYYRVFGNIKYSEMANEAYGPNNKDVNASHPRLSTTQNSNNSQNSDFWLYKSNSFIIPTIQITYHFNGKNNMSFIKDSRLFLRADNAFVFGKNKRYTELNIGSYPKTKKISIGIITSF